MNIGKNNYWSRHTELINPKEFSFFITPGVKWISEAINELFDKNGSLIKWQNNCFEQIKDNFEDYVYILKSFIEHIDNNYTGKREKNIIEIGKHINHLKLGKGIVTDIDSFGLITIEFKNKKVIFRGSGDYQEEMRNIKNKLSTDREEKIITLIYDRIK